MQSSPSYLPLFHICQTNHNRLLSLVSWYKTTVGERVWIWILTQRHQLKYSVNKHVRLWGRRMGPNSAHTLAPNSVMVLSSPHLSKGRGLKCRWMTEDCFALCGSEGWFMGIAVWVVGWYLVVWVSKRQHPCVSRGLCWRKRERLSHFFLCVLMNKGLRLRLTAGLVVSCGWSKLPQHFKWQPSTSFLCLCIVLLECFDCPVESTVKKTVTLVFMLKTSQAKPHHSDH